MASKQKGSEAVFKSYLGQRKAWPLFNRWPNPYFLEHVANERSSWVGLLQSDQIVALILYTEVLDVIELCYLETHPQHLRRGCMLRLFRYFIGQNQNATIWADVHADNRAARQLYDHLGFKCTGLRRGYYRDGGDGLQLVLTASAATTKKPVLSIT